MADTPQPISSKIFTDDEVLKTVLWQIDPLFDLRAAAMLVPMRRRSLQTFLARHKDEFPARYRLDGSGHRRVRVIYASEVRRIREQVLRGPL